MDPFLNLSISPARKKPTKPVKPKPDEWARNPDPCSECGKKFWSLKALYGHMRCHPERQWRGVRRPENSVLMSADDYEAATCLVLMANRGGDTAGHACGVCFKAFSSGQALGGHMRCHVEKNNGGGGGGAGGGCGFDLNVAVEELEEMQLVLRLGL